MYNCNAILELVMYYLFILFQFMLYKAFTQRQHLWPPAIPRLLHYLLYNVFSASACISKRPASNKKSQKNPQSQKKNPKTTLYPIPHDCVPTFPINPTLTLLLNLYVSIILDYYYNFIMITIFLYFIDYYFIASSKPIYI